MRLAAAALLAPFVFGAAAEASGWRAGVAAVVITPDEPLWAAGYGGRNKPVQEKLHDLHTKALVLQDERGSRLVIVTTDLLGLPAELAEAIAREIGARLNVSRENIVLTSSHTHCGPVLRGSLVDIYPLDDEQRAAVDRYSVRLQPLVVQAAVEAASRLSPARLAWGVGEATFAVNRRNNPEKDVVEGYVARGPTDHDVPVLRVQGADGSLLAVLFGYACHCTTMDFYQWCGDYAGFAQADLEAKHPGAAALFVAGCGADQNPLPRRKIELCRKYGRLLADGVDRVLSSEMRPLTGTLEAAMQRVELAFDHLPTRAELQAETRSSHRSTAARARRFLAELDAGRSLPASYAYPIQAVQIGQLTMVALAGEVVVDYALRLKRELGAENMWVAAYSNDLCAYIPSERVLKEGGYEGDTSMIVYGRPSKWAPGLEDRIVAAVRTAVDQARGKATRPAGG